MRNLHRLTNDYCSIILLAVIVVILLIVVTGLLLGPAIGSVFSNVISSDSFPPSSSCSVSISAKTWIDANENGLLDPGEPSLPGVEVVIDYQRSTTDWHGLATERVATSCQPRPMQLSVAAIPTGYELTTPAVYTATYSYTGTVTGPFLFGFNYLPGVPTATPRPQLACVSYLRNYRGTTKIAFGPDGQPWAAIYKTGIFQYDPVLDAWQDRTPANTLAKSASNLAFAPDGALWVAMSLYAESEAKLLDGAVARFDGQGWKFYQNSLFVPLKGVVDLSAGSDGSIWVVTDGGLSRYWPAANRWKAYKLLGSRENVSRIDSVRELRDGSIWLISSNGIAPFPQVTESDQAWLTPAIYGLWEAVAAPDGTLWVAGEELANYNPQNGQWSSYHCQEEACFYGFLSLAQAADGSLWAGTLESGAWHFNPLASVDQEPIWEFYTTADGLADNYVTDIQIAPDGALWFGTYRGISRCRFNAP